MHQCIHETMTRCMHESLTSLLHYSLMYLLNYPLSILLHACSLIYVLCVSLYPLIYFFMHLYIFFFLCASQRSCARFISVGAPQLLPVGALLMQNSMLHACVRADMFIYRYGHGIVDLCTTYTNVHRCMPEYVFFLLCVGAAKAI